MLSRALESMNLISRLVTPSPTFHRMLSLTDGQSSVVDHSASIWVVGKSSRWQIAPDEFLDRDA
jgi:hypothetical protein